MAKLIPEEIITACCQCNEIYTRYCVRRRCYVAKNIDVDREIDPDCPLADAVADPRPFDDPCHRATITTSCSGNKVCWRKEGIELKPPQAWATCPYGKGWKGEGT